MTGIGITTINGFHLSMEERFKMFRNAGFESLLMWWGDEEIESKAERVKLAEKYNLSIENAHAPTENLNNLWLDNDNGTEIVHQLKKCVIDCKELGIKTMVLHLTNGSNPPHVSSIGIKRIEQIIECAVKSNVILAFENMMTVEHVQYILDNYVSQNVKFCYDSGHEHYWAPKMNWLEKYGDCLAAIHLNDNFAHGDLHLIPGDGNIDFEGIMNKISKSTYSGTLTLEVEMSSSNLYDEIGFELFLNRAYNQGLELRDMLEKKRRK